MILLALLLAAGDPLETAVDSHVVGDVLAGDLLGVQALKPIQPSSPAAAMAALKTLDKDGKVAPGVAVEVTPFDLWLGQHMPYEEYAQQGMKRDLATSAISIATQSQGSGTSSAVRTALAYRFRLFDDTDWRLNSAAIACVRKLGTAPPPAAPPGDPVTSSPVQPDAAKLKKCLSDNTPWNAGQAALGIGASAVSPGGIIGSTKGDGLYGYAGWAFPLGTSLQGTATARYTHSFVSGGDTDVAGLGARLRWNTTSWLVLSVDGGLGRQWNTAPQWKGLFGADVKLKVTSTLWVEGGATWTFDRDSNGTITSGIKWSYEVAPGS